MTPEERIMAAAIILRDAVEELRSQSAAGDSVADEVAA